MPRPVHTNLAWDLCAAHGCNTEHSHARASLCDSQRHLCTSVCTKGALLHDSSPLPCLAVQCALLLRARRRAGRPTPQVKRPAS
eukprot:5572221-Alexandrium_andersonii.AAC.1